MRIHACFVRRFAQTMEQLEVTFDLVVSIGVFVFISLPGGSYAATIASSSCAQADVQSAVNASSIGDTVTIPAGNCTWGANASYISVNKAITLQGAGQGQTVITLSDSGGKYSNGTIRISAAATVKSMTINGSDVNPVTALSTSNANDWRITDIEYNGGTAGAYFVYVGEVYGLIDHNDITGKALNAEFIFARGPSDSWQTPHTMGGPENLFVEDNVFSAPTITSNSQQAYVCDINSNGRAVFRYNTINGPMKIDGHGKASNTPPRGVRQMEVYNNTWTNANNVEYWTAIEMRGGTGRVFDNVINTSKTIRVILTEYGCTGLWKSFDNVCQCPSDYPIDDQIGVGQDPKSAASEPMYLWGNTQNGSPVTLTWRTTSACTTACGSFTLQNDIIKEGRDFFISNTKPAAMANYTPYPYPHPLAQTGTTTVPDPTISIPSGFSTQ